MVDQWIRNDFPVFRCPMQINSTYSIIIILYLPDSKQINLAEFQIRSSL